MLINDALKENIRYEVHKQLQKVEFVKKTTSWFFAKLFGLNSFRKRENTIS